MRPVRSRSWASSRCWINPTPSATTSAHTATVATEIHSPRRRSSGVRTGTYAGFGPRATVRVPRLLLFPLIAMPSRSLYRPLSVHEPANDDSGLVEQDHGNGHRQQCVRVAAGCDYRSKDEDQQDRRPAPSSQLGGADHAGHLEEYERDRELERQAEREGQQHHEREEPIAGEQGRRDGAGEPEEEAQCPRQRPVREQRAEGEQQHRAHDERDGQPALTLREPRNHERPQLVQHDRERYEQAEVPDQLQLQQHGAERLGEEQRALGSGTTIEWDRFVVVAVRVKEQGGNAVVQSPRNDRADG